MSHQQSKRRRGNPAMKQTPNKWNPEQAQRRLERLKQDLANRYTYKSPPTLRPEPTNPEQAQARLERIQRALALVARYPPQLGRVDPEPTKWEVGK